MYHYPVRRGNHIDSQDIYKLDGTDELSIAIITDIRNAPSKEVVVLLQDLIGAAFPCQETLVVWIRQARWSVVKTHLKHVTI